MIQYMFLADILLSIMSSSFIHFLAHGNISSYFMTYIYIYIYILHICFIHLPVDRHIDCSHVLTVDYNVATNMRVQLYIFDILTCIFIDANYIM